MGGGGGGQGDGDQMAQLTAAVLALERSMNGVVGVLDQQGLMLRELLAAAAENVREGRVDELLVALIGRLDRHAAMMERVEAGIEGVRAAVEGTGR